MPKLEPQPHPAAACGLSTLNAAPPSDSTKSTVLPAMRSSSASLSPSSTVVIRMLENPPVGGVLWCDGRRSTSVKPSSEVTVRRSPLKLRLARTSEQPFVQRLVRKFDLPVHGWRGQAERDAAARKAAEAGDAG